MNIRLSVITLGVIAFPGFTFGQNQATVVSVCEVLANLNDYGNSVIAIVGRLDVTGVIYDRRHYVSQDQCENPIVADDFVWPNRILIATTHEKGLPNPPTDTPDLSLPLLVDKLASMRGKTILGVRNEFRVNKSGELVNFIARNSWVVAYGHTYSPSHLTTAESCKEVGCNGFAGRVPLIIMVDPKNVHLLNEDGTFNDTPGK